jgi:hypothetical protein
MIDYFDRLVFKFHLCGINIFNKYQYTKYGDNKQDQHPGYNAENGCQ